MKDILTEIIAHKQEELKLWQQKTPIETLRKRVASQTATPKRSMKQALSSSATGIIAEFKRKSPSKGWIHREARPEKIVPAYQACGASALSILTDEYFFGGTLADIETVRPLVNIPILRKDFIISEYQLLQARLSGADAVLLIAACLTVDKCTELARQAHDLGLEILLEIHSSEEVEYAQCAPEMLGVNNRNLGTFITDVRNSYRLAEALKPVMTEQKNAPLLVSESGISQSETIQNLRQLGYRGFLIGETFMKEPHPGQALQHLIESL